MKILVLGLPGAGKTFLAERLAKLLGAVHFNADRVRATINTDLGFGTSDRVEHARRMGWMCQLVKDSGHIAIADFVCPTEETRKAFNADFTIWLNTINEGRFEDTNKLFEPPVDADIVITDFEYDLEAIAKILNDDQTVNEQIDLFDHHAPSALLLGRYQPFHDGHYNLALEALNRVGHICFAVRNTTGLEKNPFSFSEVRARIQSKFESEGTWDPKKIKILQVPNITNVFYGRDVGYSIEKIELDSAFQDVSATKIRKEMGIN